MSTSFRPLRGLRILSLGLNVPAPIALQRAKALGAKVLKVEPPGGEALAQAAPRAYADLNAGIRIVHKDLKTESGLAWLQAELARCDVLLTSFRRSAMDRLGLSWRTLQRAHPQLWHVAVVSGQGQRADEAGHDLTYQAEVGLLAPGSPMPRSLLADMAGAEQATQALLMAALGRLQGARPRYLEIGLAEAAAELARPVTWGVTAPGAVLGGGHAFYRFLRCQDGWVALAALEPHFAARVAQVAGLAAGWNPMGVETHRAVARWVRRQTGAALRELARTQDLPLVVCPDAPNGG
ncbi:CoA transferase [Inhella gelatinilytica]|uniref:CoA transferase n=1 Tax=Inhella gelatinilytica TaxID=2795030 RepID=A0A931NE38_9BURK|nr:CoA transferase [Inhella gelatinilytica]MBH9553757.1 CoA transferase [Inhella gelatinilytica]